MFKKIAFFALFLAVTGLFGAGSVNAQSGEPIQFTPAQCANGGVGKPANNCGFEADGVTPSDANWEKGNMNGQKSHYPEGSNIHYQYVFTGLTGGTTYTFRVGYDAWEGTNDLVAGGSSTAHTIDYLNTYNAGFDGAPLTEYKVNPCGGVAGCTGAGLQFAIPDDPTLSNVIEPGGRFFTAWRVSAASAVFLNVANPAAGERVIEITFTTAPGATSAVIAWSGHIAKTSEWGALVSGDTGAGGQTGSPYHMRNAGDGSFGDGQQELQLQASAVVPVPVVKGFKTVRLGRQEGDDTFAQGVINLQDTVVWTIRYINTSTVNIPNFQIQDTIHPGLVYEAGSLIANTVKLNPLAVALVPTNPNFDGTNDINVFGPGGVLLEAGTMITVRFRTRVVQAGPIPNQAFGSGSGLPTPVSTDSADDEIPDTVSGYSTAGECVTTIAGLDEGTAGGCYDQDVWETVGIDPTYIDTLAGPTAADVEISGRVTDSYGRGIAREQITLQDAASGERKYIMTNTFGYFRFTDVPVGAFYVLSVNSKRYTYQTPSLALNLQDNLTDVSFVASRTVSKGTVSLSPEKKVSLDAKVVESAVVLAAPVKTVIAAPVETVKAPIRRTIVLKQSKSKVSEEEDEDEVN